MSGIYGALGLNTTDSQRVFLSTIGQSVIYDAAKVTLAQHNADMDDAMRIFVDKTTDDHKRRYMLPGSGYMQRMEGQSRPSAAKATGSWDVAFPLEQYGAGWGADRIAFAYQTMNDLDLHLDAVFMRNANTMRMEILRPLYNNVNRTFADPLWGSLTCVPLANNDSTTYPPLIGSDTENTAQQNYVASGYVSASISDTNNPIKTIVDNLESVFGTPTGGSRIVVFCNNAETPYFEALTNFIPFTNRFLSPGDDQTVTSNLPAEVMTPSSTWRVIGTCSGAVICEWRAGAEAAYLLGIHLDAPKPLEKRIDPAYTGLGSGLQLVNYSDVRPWVESDYINRYGFAVGNRLNGMVVQLTTGSYTIPTKYA